MGSADRRRLPSCHAPLQEKNGVSITCINRHSSSNWGYFLEETIDLDLAHAMILKMTGIVRFAEITLNHANSGISGIEGVKNNRAK